MQHKQIITTNAPAPGNYSQGRIVEFDQCTIVCTSGQTGNDPKTDDVVGNDIESQTLRTLKNIEGIINEARGSIEDIVTITVYLKNMSRDKQGFDAIYKSFFTGCKYLPARSLVEVVEIPLITENTIVEIQATAYISKSSSTH
jgi:2-iminobutanoate/2-iminopropanoate deaminase